MNRLPRRFAALVLLSALAGVSCIGSGDAGEIGTAEGFNVVRYPDAAARREVPGFTSEEVRPGADAVDSSMLAGAPSVVNFWGSWCGPCREEQPELTALYEEYRERGVQFLGINVRDSRANAEAYLAEFSVPYPSAFSPDASLAHLFRVTVMPSTFVLDAEGRIAAKIVGALRAPEDLRRLLDAELSP